MRKHLLFKSIILILVAIIALLVLNILINNRIPKERQSLIQHRIDHKTKLMKAQSVRKTFEFLIDITQDSLKYVNNLVFVFYYTNYDCNSCILDGFEICDKINKICGQNVINIISTANDRYGAESFIDSEMELQNKLTSIYSPVFFIFDDNFNFKDLYLCDSNAEHNIRKGVKFLKRFLR